MSNFIDKIQISGTSYDVKDASAVTVINITQADYDELPESAKTENILYNITDATPVDISQYWTSGQTNSAINAAVSGKLDTSTFQTYSGDVDTALANKVETSAITTAVTTASTDSEIPTAKAVNDAIAAGGGGGITSGEVQTMIDESVSGKADTSAVTAVQDSLSGYVRTNIPQDITSTKTFVNTDKGIIFKQKENGNKVGFSLRSSALSNNEIATFEFRPDTYTDSRSVSHPLLYLGHYRKTSIANNGIVQTMVGFRQYDQHGAAAYHYLMPLPAEAKTPFSLTTSFKNYFAPLGFKVDTGGTMVTTDNTGVVDLSSYIGGGGGGGGKAIEAGRGIDVTTGATADTISIGLPISAGTGTKSLILGYYHDEDSYWNSQASGEGSLACGVRCVADGYSTSFAIGYLNKAIGGYGSFAHGYMTYASGGRSHSEGMATSATSDASHSEGNETTASGNHSHSEGWSTTANGQGAHAEGQGTLASQNYSHAEGWSTTANSEYSHSEGAYTLVYGGADYAHAEGRETSAMTNGAHTEGCGTKALNYYEHAQGWYNVSNTGSTDADTTIFSVGNGTADNARHNAFEIRKNGDIYISSGGTDIKLQDNLGGGGTVDQTVISGSTNAVAGGAVYDQLGGMKIVKLTESEYAALVTKDPDVLYVVIPDPSN